MFEDRVFLDATAALAAVRDAATAENQAAHARITTAVAFARLCEREDELRWDPELPQWVDAGSGADTELCMLLLAARQRHAYVPF